MSSLGYEGIAVLFAAAAIVSIVFKKLRQPLILGYIVAGVLSASFLTSDTNLISLISDLGITLLAFTMGMELSLNVLKEIGKKVIVAGVIELMLMLPAGYIVSLAFGWSPQTAIFFAAAFALTSTTVVTKTMRDCRESIKSYSDLVLGLLVVEDLLTVGLLAILSGITSHQAFGPVQLLELMGGMAFFAIVSLILAINVIPRAINHIVNFGNDEIIIITSMGLCFALALFASELGFSFVIGAFIVGIAVAESDHKDRIHSRMVPIRDVFLAVFFVSIGTLIQTSYVIQLLPVALLLGVAFIIWKFVSVTLGFTFTGFGLRNASYVGVAAGAIGEFSFVIGRLGLEFGIFTQGIYTLIVLISAVTIVILPQTIRRNERVYNYVKSKTPSGVILYALAIRGFVVRILKQISGPVKMEKPSRAFLLTFGLNVMVIVSILIMTKYFVSYAGVLSSNSPFDLTLLMLGYIVAVVLILYASLNTLTRETERFFGDRDMESCFAAKLVRRLLQVVYVAVGYLVIASSITSIFYFAPVIVLISVAVSAAIIFLLWKGISDLSISIPGASEKGSKKTAKSENELLVELMLR